MTIMYQMYPTTGAARFFVQRDLLAHFVTASIFYLKLSLRVCMFLHMGWSQYFFVITYVLLFVFFSDAILIAEDLCSCTQNIPGTSFLKNNVFIDIFCVSDIIAHCVTVAK